MTRFVQWVRGLPLLVHLVGAGLLVQCLALGIAYFGQTRLIHDAMHKLAANHAAQTTPLLASALANAMAQRDYATLQAIVDEAVSPQGITVITVFDEQGRQITNEKLSADTSAKASLLETTVPLALGGQLLGHAQLRFSRAAVDTLYGELYGWQIMISVLALAAAVLGLSLLSYTLIRPLKQLTYVTRAMALNATAGAPRASTAPQAPHLARRVSATGAMAPAVGAEIGALQASFTSMSQAIARQISDLHQARHAAELANRTKSEFLSKVSHEIRTPMNGVMGMIDLLRDGGLQPDQLALANIAYDSSESLMLIINDILDFSKMEAGKFQLTISPLLLKPQFDSAIQLFAASATRKSLALELVWDPTLPHQVAGDALALRQILSNLIGNAIKFTVTGGVRVSASPADDGTTLCVRVTDSGVGIDANLLSSIFEPFVQGDDSNTRRFGGTGLGLAIVHNLCTAMGGSIGINSTVGVGSEFLLTLPLVTPSLATTSHTAENAQENATGEATALAPDGGAPKPATPSLRGLRVLIVEDNETNLLVAESILTAFECETVSALNGLEALEKLAAQSFDAVLMDCQMPVMDGYEATRRLRQRERESGKPRMPVLAVTANANQGDRALCIAQGMDDYLPKPYNATALIEILAKYRTHLQREETHLPA